MSRYVALLRGINVGGKNIIKMSELRACLETHGFADVVTYIQSGNVLFTSTASDVDRIARRMEGVLSEAFRYRSSVVLRTLGQMRGVVERAPDGFGADPARCRYDVLFLKAPLLAATALGTVPAKEGVDEVTAGVGVLYYSRLIRKAASSHLSRLVSMPIYQDMTIRNWNTTTTLLRMMEET